ncbi:hypothetical protein DDQ68_16160 [Hymenobacter nivis]|uniref:Uncharacterized protein n=2 Tax=Hymenobacter nivis TaxID=1850093 RepID=A0A2Z3GXT3_9BACT|nr:hypothetical protein DDQ68_16160 [Hymenobacter nivis]
MLLAEVEQHAHLPGYGYRRHYPPDYLTPEREAEIVASGRATLRAVREWHTRAILSLVEQFLDRARKIELWQNDRHQLTTREGGLEEWGEEYAVLLMALRRAVPTAKKQLLRAAYTELKQLLPTLAASRPLKWQRLHDEGYPFFSSSLTATYPYSEFVPLRPTQTTTSQITEFFFQYLHLHLFQKEWHVWQALILLAGALGEAAPPTPATFQEKQAAAAPHLDTPAPASLRPELPEKPTAALTVAELCCNGFAPPNLNDLLKRLKVIDTDGNCLTNKLLGKAQGKRGAFTAAYRVLHRAGLLAPTATDKVWADAFKKEYDANLGADVIAHQLTPHGQAPTSAPGPFQSAVADAIEWVNERKAAAKPPFIAP